MKKAAELHSASDDTPGVFPILGATALVLVLNLLAMLTAERVLKSPFVAAVLGITGSVMAVLQIALSIQAMISGLRLLGVVAAAGA